MLLLETRRKDKQTRWSAVAASDGALIAHKPAVCGRDFPIACLRTASRASTASNRGGNVFFSANASICIHSSQSSICIARKLACSSRCSLGLLRAVSLTERALRAPRKNARNDVHAVISDKSLFFRGFVHTLRGFGAERSHILFLWYNSCPRSIMR